MRYALDISPNGIDARIYDSYENKLYYMSASFLEERGIYNRLRGVYTATEADFYELLAEYNGLVSEGGKETPKTTCWHEWVEYVGLNESYSFCKKCDKKESEV